ncbi:MAG: HDOD domain-containing protein [Candidatus Latescibacterota bacterium]
MSVADGERRERVRQIVEQAGSLPTLPEAVLRIAEMVDAPDTTGRQLATQISRDQVFSAKVLKLVNSGFYGFSQPIATVRHAVTMLGFNAVKSLLLSVAVLDRMNQAFPGLWEHSMACARTCWIIADHLQIAEPEELSTTGLLHDLGKVVVYQTLKDAFVRVRLRVEKKGMLVYEAEREVLGADHGEIGTWLLARWALPGGLTAPIGEHHRFDPGHEHAVRTAAVHLADVLCRAEAFGSGGDWRIPRLDPRALETLQASLDDVESIMERMTQELAAIPRLASG